MRLIKAFLIGATGLFVIITLFSLLIPSRVSVSRATLINNTNAGEVYKQIAYLENWKKWHPVFINDSATLFCNDTHKAGERSGCVITHHDKQIVITLTPADSMSFKFLLQSKGDNDIDNEIVITAVPAQKSVLVEWKAITKLHWYPWEKFYGIFIDKITGPGYEGALTGLKDYMEKVTVAFSTEPY